MSDVIPDPVPDPTPDQGFSETDLRRVIGEEIDSRISTDSLSKLEKLDLLDSLDERMEGLFKKHGKASSSSDFDKKGFLDEIGSLIDTKIQGLGNAGGSGNAATPAGKRNPGPLARFLGFGNPAT